MRRSLGLILLVLLSALAGVVVGWGALAVLSHPLSGRNAILVCIMALTAIVSLLNAIALWRASPSADRIFVLWYVGLCLTILTRHLYMEWSPARIATLVIEIGLLAVIGIVVTRYVRTRLLLHAVSPAH